MVLLDAQLRGVMPSCKVSVYLPLLNAVFVEFDINNVERVCAFLAQVAHESSELNVLSENLNYGIASLMKTWPNRFQSVEQATPFAHNPEKLANAVYADRMGNGNEASGDGWKFRGAGAIQLTGRDNHKAFSDYSGAPLEDVSNWMRTPEGAVRSAGWFWKKSNLNVLADSCDQQAICRRVNGGYTGLSDRLDYYTKAKQFIY